MAILRRTDVLPLPPLLPLLLPPHQYSIIHADSVHYMTYIHTYTQNQARTRNHYPARKRYPISFAPSNHSTTESSPIFVSGRVHYIPGVMDGQDWTGQDRTGQLIRNNAFPVFGKICLRMTMPVQSNLKGTYGVLTGSDSVVRERLAGWERV